MKGKTYSTEEIIWILLQTDGGETGLCCMNRSWGIETRQAFHLDWYVVLCKKHVPLFPQSL